MDSKDHIILTALARGAMTADEFVTRRGWYINSWAPTFTELRKAGLVKRSGIQRATTHGAMAHVIEITHDGLAHLNRAVTKGAA